MLSNSQESSQDLPRAKDHRPRRSKKNKTTKNNIAYELGMYAIQQGSTDNISIIIVFF